MSRRSKVWLSIGAIAVIALVDFVYALTRCSTVHVIVVNNSADKASRIVLHTDRETNYTEWRGSLDFLQAVSISMPVRQGRIVHIDVSLANGTELSAMGGYPLHLSDITSIFIIRRDRIEHGEFDGPLRLTQGPLRLIGEALSYPSIVLDKLTCPARYLWHSVERPQDAGK